MSDDTRRDEKRQPEAGRADDPTPPAGPHAKPELTNKDATPGAGSLPDRDGDEAGGTG